MGVPSDRSHQPGQPRDRQGPGLGDRRDGDQRGPEDHRRGPEGEGAHRARRRDHHQRAAQGRAHHLHRRRHERTPRRRRGLRDAADLRHVAQDRPGDHGRRAGSGLSREGRRRRQLRGRGAQHQPAAPDAARRRHRRVRQRHDAVRARRADARAEGRRQDHLHHLLAGLRAAELRRPADRAGGRARAHRRVDAPQGRHRDEDGPQHADHDCDDQGRQDLRQSDGRRPDRVREAEGSRAPHHRHGDRARRTTKPTRCSSAPSGTSRRRS